MQLKRGCRFVLHAAVYNQMHDIFCERNNRENILFKSLATRISSAPVLNLLRCSVFAAMTGGQTPVGYFISGGFAWFLELHVPRVPSLFPDHPRTLRRALLSRHKSPISLAKNRKGNDQYAVHNEELLIPFDPLPVLSTQSGLYRSQTHFSKYKLKEMSYFSLCKPPRMAQFNPQDLHRVKEWLEVFVCLLHTALGDKTQTFLRF